MKTLRRITLLFILALFCHSADHRAVLRAHQANDGLWHDGSKTDLSGTLFALMVLEASSAPEDVAATQRTRAAIYLNCQEDGSLLGTLPFALASQSDDIFMLSSFHNEEGWIQEPGGFPDWATTLLMLLLAPSNGRTEQDCAFLLKDTPPDNIRASLLLLFAYLRHHLQPPSALLHLLDKDVELFGFFEQALALFSLARLSRWDEALKLRTHLLASQLPEGGWGEAEGFPFDVVTTSLAILALDCFHVNENTLSPDLSLKESTTSLEDDNAYTRLTTVVSNMGSVASGTFQLSISALMPSEVLPLACATVPYLAPGKSQSLSLLLTIPPDCTGIVLEADPTGTTGDALRDNNSILVMLSDTFPCTHLGEMLFDWRKPIYPYYLNPGFGAIASISILSPNPASSLRWKWMCDGSIFSTGGMEHPDARQPIRLQADCFPPEGRHTIAIQVIQTLGESSYTLEESLDIEVLYNSCGLFCHPLNEKDDLPHDVFTARKEVLLDAFCSNPDAIANVSIFDSSGAYIGNAAAEMTPGKFRWNTEALPPGHYKAIAYFWEYDTMDIPTDAECLFEITPSSTSSNLVIHSITDKNTGFRFYKGLSSSPAVSLGWETAANIPTTCLFSWEILDETAAIIAKSTTEIAIDASLASLRQWQLLELPGILFESAATYSLHIKMIANELTFNAVHSIEVSRPPGLVCENRLHHPDGIIDQTGSLCLPPSDGTATLLTDIFRISIQDESLAIPCSLQCGASPLFLHDTPENTITITLEEIANALGNLITSGWLLCQTPYGFLSGENDLTPGWPYGSSIAIPIHNGTASFIYTPQGETPDNLSFLIPIEIFPYKHGKTIDSRRIGIIEIFMTKQL